MTTRDELMALKRVAGEEALKLVTFKVSVLYLGLSIPADS